MYEELVRKIEQRRAELGLSERAVCRLAGLRPDALRAIRKGHAPRIEVIIRLERALKMRPRALINVFYSAPARQKAA